MLTFFSWNRGRLKNTQFMLDGNSTAVKTKDKTYHLIQGCKEGLDLGPMPMKFNRDLTVKEDLTMPKWIFLPNSQNYLGHAEHFTFQIGNFDNTSLDENIKVLECVSGTESCRVYLLSKNLIQLKKSPKFC
jgi:hypothetical protein